MKVFVDTNVLLDVLAHREPFYAHSAHVWSLAESGRITAFSSVLSLPNLYYILRKEKGAAAARKAITGLRDIFTLVAVDNQIVNQALDSGIRDFEDALQCFSALRAGASVLVTRNPKDFPHQDLPIQTPAQFLASHLGAEL